MVEEGLSLLLLVLVLVLLLLLMVLFLWTTALMLMPSPGPTAVGFQTVQLKQLSSGLKSVPVLVTVAVVGFGCCGRRMLVIRNCRSADASGSVKWWWWWV